MCQPKSEGGKRCDCDNSAARRKRRKASSLRESGKAPYTSQDPSVALPEPISASIKELREQAQAIHELAHSKPENMPLHVHDEIVERQVTQLGKDIALEAENRVGRTVADVTADTISYDARRMNELKEEAKALSALGEESYDAWTEIEDNVLQVEDAGKEYTEEELSVLNDEQREVYRQRMELAKKWEQHELDKRNIHSELAKYTNETYAAHSMALAKAYQDIIKEIRPVGGEMNYKLDDIREDNEQIKELLSETIEQHYPTAWLNYHNESEEILVRTTDRRPQYLHSFLSDTESDGELKPYEDVRIPASFSSLENVERVKKALGDEKVKSFSYKPFAQGPTEQNIVYVGPPYELYNEMFMPPMIDGKPQGDGWEYRPTIASMNILESYKEEHIMEMLEQPRWVRLETTTRKRQPFLEIHSKEGLKKPNEPGLEHAQFAKAIAYHEFAHRVESVFPDNLLARQEKAFLKRRAGKTEENLHSDIGTSGAPGEYAFKSDFVSSYTGKEYFTEKNYEVFSTGIEAVYGGSYGGLVKSSRMVGVEDPDHRGFTLGALATL
jgi:hypothetical protein